MLNYSKKCINTITICTTLIICIILFIILDFSFFKIPYKNNDQKVDINFAKIEKNNYINRGKFDSIKINDIFFDLMQIDDIYNDVQLVNGGAQDNNEETNNNLVDYKSKWRVEIPKIGVIAPIKSGTTQNILATAVGHFENSMTWKGNVALAGHNRGYNCNFFQDIKRLEKGDKIIYYTNKGKREYKVILNKIIPQTDWSYVENTKDNRLTLITCVENMYEYRRCVQAVEII